MKQVYLKPRGRLPGELRSDTLFGLIAVGVREVHGREAVDRVLAPLFEEGAEPPLLLTSAFPYVTRDGARVHYFPAPIDRAAPGVRSLIEDRELLALVAGRDVESRSVEPGRPDGWFFLAQGRGETLLEGALGYLEQSGFGGRASSGGGAFEVELCEAEFLRTAQPGELGLLLSLYLPTPQEGSEIGVAAAAGEARYQVCRRQGSIDRARYRTDEPRKRAVVMMTEGSVLPVTSSTPGTSPVVGRADDGHAPFDVIQHGHGFFVPMAAAPVTAGGPA